MKDELRRALQATPYVIGGRELGRGLDCLGTVLEVLRELEMPVECRPDPWRAIAANWRAGSLEAYTGFPSCWRRDRCAVQSLWRTGDVLVLSGRHHGAAVVAFGYVWTADDEIGGPYCRPIERWQKQPAEVWRHDPTAHQARPVG